MISMKQLIANQQNAQKSTGPRTIEGKTVVAKNAIKHGFFAKEVLLSEEEVEEFNGFFQEMLTYLGPQSPLECMLAERVISAAWRLRRIVQVESYLYRDNCRWDLSNLFKGAFEGESALSMAILSRYEQAIERSLFHNLKELQRLQSARMHSLENGFVL